MWPRSIFFRIKIAIDLYDISERRETYLGMKIGIFAKSEKGLHNPFICFIIYMDCTVCLLYGIGLVAAIRQKAFS